jgi:hypothetical protein
MLMLPYQELREDGRSCSNASALNVAKAAEGNEDRRRQLWTAAKWAEMRTVREDPAQV